MTGAPRGLVAALAAGLAGCVLAPAAWADTTTVQGSQLVLNDTLADDIVIATDASLAGRVRVAREDGLDCLGLVGGATAVINTDGCSGSDLHIDIPSGMSVVVNATGDGDITMGDLLAPLVINARGSGDIHLGRVGVFTLVTQGGSDVSLGTVGGPATITSTGSGDVRMEHLNGVLVLRHTGSGDFSVGSIAAATADVQTSGSGDVIIGGGTVGQLHVAVQGSGDVALAATARDADVSAYGGGDVRLGPVTGTLSKHHGGGSDIYTGGPSEIDGAVSGIANLISGNVTGREAARSHGGSGWLTHALMLAVLVFGGVIAWRIRNRGARPLRAAGPANPAIAAVCDRFAALDQRLGRVETYVTSREFDLQRKFREMGR